MLKIIVNYAWFFGGGWILQLQQMQDEILIKNGEIRILRDSMKQMESAAEEQRKSHLLLEEEKEQHLREKEKEFSKKVLPDSHQKLVGLVNVKYSHLETCAAIPGCSIGTMAL